MIRIKVFHEYENIENLLLNDVKMEVPDEGDYVLEHSHALIQHNGYKDDSVDTFIRLMIIAIYKEENNYYHLNGSTRANYNHLVFSHLRSDLEMTAYYYITGVSEVIDKSFTIALIISIVIAFVLIILLIGPITASTVAISRYFKTTLHVLCQAPPDVFNRSFYINKWLKGQISRSN
ncbi:hypothetical protein M9Y10_005750 [Tritrichomonas musculus]|uniref:Uncharacterized protein n=1 Tax=Tritrichomonas musculus TaxID=1915356 RepID=A0ABR2JCH7_9EUKA